MRVSQAGAKAFTGSNWLREAQVALIRNLRPIGTVLEEKQVLWDHTVKIGAEINGNAGLEPFFFLQMPPVHFCDAAAKMTYISASGSLLMCYRAVAPLFRV